MGAPCTKKAAPDKVATGNAGAAGNGEAAVAHFTLLQRRCREHRFIPSAHEESPALDQKKRETIGSYIDAYNAGDVESMLVLLTPDVRFENYFNDTLTASSSGTSEFRQVAQLGKLQFPKREQRVVDVRVDGEQALAQIEFEGLLSRDLPEGSIAGATVHLRGTTEFTFAGELIARVVDRSHATGREGTAPVT